MTSQASGGMKLSKLSILALADLGYAVDTSADDDYTFLKTTKSDHQYSSRPSSPSLMREDIAFANYDSIFSLWHVNDDEIDRGVRGHGKTTRSNGRR